MNPSSPEKLLIDIAKSITSPNMEQVDQLIRCLPSINAADDKGFTALHWAAFNGHELMSRLLVAHGADVTAHNQFGKPPAALAGENFAFGRTGPNGAELEAIHQRKASIYRFLLQSGSPYHTLEAHSTPELIRYRDRWFSEASDAWRHWSTSSTPPNVSAITPAMLLKFTSHGQEIEALQPSRWHGREDDLRNLISSPDIPPCHVDRWLNTISGLTNLFTPGTCITQQQQEPSRLSSGRVDKAARA